MGRKVLLVLASLAVTACGSEQIPPQAPSQEQLNPIVTDIEFPGTNVYFACHGTVGIYMAEDNVEAQSSPFAVPNHPECEPS